MTVASFNFFLNESYLLDSSYLSDSPLPVFKTFQDILKENLTVLFVLFVFLGLVLIVWFYLKYKKRKIPEVETEVFSDPYEDALIAIADLQKKSSHLNPKPLLFKLSEILRVYVERLFLFPAMELTGEEFMREIASHSFFDDDFESLLKDFVSRGDRIKYSEETIDEQETKNLLNSALQFVKEANAKFEQEKKAEMLAEKK